MTTDQIKSLVPEGKRPTNLKVVELDYASKRLGVNVMTALMNDDKGDPHPRQAYALACVALCWARRVDPGAKLETYTDMELPELMALLGYTKGAGEEEPNLDPDDPSRSPSG